MNRIAYAICAVLVLGLLAGCSAKAKPDPAPAAPLTLEHIDSYKPVEASVQALEVAQSNPYSREFLDKVFARLVDQCGHSKSPENAEIIWNNFVAPLADSGHVPPDLPKRAWNEYFSRSFASLPTHGTLRDHCVELPRVKQAIEQEYQLKRAGFEVTNQGSPDSHFLNAMYVYNTMWATCHPAQ